MQLRAWSVVYEIGFLPVNPDATSISASIEVHLSFPACLGVAANELSMVLVSFARDKLSAVCLAHTNTKSPSKGMTHGCLTR
jgi:hypothetical protein